MVNDMKETPRAGSEPRFIEVLSRCHNPLQPGEPNPGNAPSLSHLTVPLWENEWEKLLELLQMSNIQLFPLCSYVISVKRVTFFCSDTDKFRHLAGNGSLLLRKNSHFSDCDSS